MAHCHNLVSMDMKRKKFYMMVLPLCVIGLYFLYRFIRIHSSIIGIADVLSFISLVFIGFSLLETIRQRTTSYKPKPLMTYKRLYLQCKRDGFPIIWKNHFIDYYSEVYNKEDSGFYLDFYNAGVGPAIDVRFIWNFNKDQIVQTYQDFAEKFPDYISYNPQTRQVKMSSVDKRSTTVYSLFQEDEENTFPITSMAPYSVKDHHKIGIPFSYLKYLEAYSYLKITKEQQKRVTAPEPLKCKLRFDDTGDKSYSLKFNLMFTFENVVEMVFVQNEVPYKNCNYARCTYKITK